MGNPGVIGEGSMTDSRSGVCGMADVGVSGSSVGTPEVSSVAEIGGGDDALARTLFSTSKYVVVRH